MRLSEEMPELANADKLAKKPALLEVTGLSFGYDRNNPLFHELDFSILPGQSIGLCGPNGAGKTTFLRCLTGLVKPWQGAIYLHGRQIGSEKDFCILRKSVGYALQNAEDQLFFPSVLEDLAFGPLNLGFRPDEARERARQVLKVVGLENFENKLIHKLSGGQKRLVALAAVLALEPELLLLDEPLNGLDEKAQERIGEVLANLNCAKIIVAHDRKFLQRLCPQILAFAKGRLTPLDI